MTTEQQTQPDPHTTKLLLEKRIGEGDAQAMFLLAKMYRGGDLGEPNMEKARELFEQAIAKDHVRSMFSLAYMYDTGDFGLPDYAKAKTLYEQAVTQGNSASMHNLACMYENGKLGEPDFETAKTLYEQAIAQGHVKAMFNLAYLYLTKKFGTSNISQAGKYYQMAANKGYAEAIYNLGVISYHGLTYSHWVIYKQNKKRAQELFSSAAKLGHQRAQSLLPNPMIQTVLTAMGRKAIKPNLKKTIHLALESLEEAFFTLRKQHIVHLPIKLAHFTTWQALESILAPEARKTGKNCLRQYHVDYMNDPSEGQRLLNFRGSSSATEHEQASKASQQLHDLFHRYYYESFNRHNSTGSLLPSVFTVSLTEESDRLDLWRAYGRDGSGYCLALHIETNGGDEFLHQRNRSASQEFLLDGKNDRFTSSGESEIPLLYSMRYADKDVVEALNQLAQPLEKIFAIKDKVSEAIWEKIASCSTAILLELLYLYKDEQYSTEKEARALTVMRLDNPKVKTDERTPGHLYCETPAFLFQTAGSEIILGPKVPNPAASIWNIRHRLTGLGLANNTIVRKSNVPYR